MVKRFSYFKAKFVQEVTLNILITKAFDMRAKMYLED